MTDDARLESEVSRFGKNLPTLQMVAVSLVSLIPFTLGIGFAGATTELWLSLTSLGAGYFATMFIFTKLAGGTDE